MGIVQEFRVWRIPSHVVEFEFGCARFAQGWPAFVYVADVFFRVIHINHTGVGCCQCLYVVALAGCIGQVACVVGLYPVVGILAIVDPSVFFLQHSFGGKSAGFDVVCLCAQRIYAIHIVYGGGLIVVSAYSSVSIGVLAMHWCAVFGHGVTFADISYISVAAVD